MKIRLSLVFFVVLCLSALIPLMASANESEYSVYINGKELNTDYTPITKNNAVYVPLWAVLGQLNMSTEDYNGVLKINHPNRILMVISDQNILTYIGRKGDVHSTRLEYPIISENYVMYTPLTFLSEYFDMQVAYGENGRIDITVGDLSKDVAWATPKGYNYTLDTIAKKFKLDADAEAFWKSNPTLWNKYRPIGNALMEEKFNEQTIISYNGSTVTLVNNEKEYTVTFASMKSIEDTFLTSDPLGDYNWSESIKSAIRHENVKVGMTKEMVVLTWRNPNDIKKYSNKNSYIEQWIYKGNREFKYDFVYFDVSGKVTSVQE